MPTYDYHCTVCDHRFEELQSIKAEPLTTCPRCGGKVERLIGTGAVLHFKGAGFYATDYGKPQKDTSMPDLMPPKKGE